MLTTLRNLAITLLLFASAATAQAAAAFDHQHAAWTTLLQSHVVDQRGGATTAVRYADFARDRAALKTYLKSLSGVTRAQYAQWSKPQQLAFLINAYNAYTVELILTGYPGLKSIRDLGSTPCAPPSATPVRSPRSTGI